MLLFKVLIQLIAKLLILYIYIWFLLTLLKYMLNKVKGRHDISFIHLCASTPTISYIICHLQAPETWIWFFMTSLLSSGHLSPTLYLTQFFYLECSCIFIKVKLKYHLVTIIVLPYHPQEAITNSTSLINNLIHSLLECVTNSMAGISMGFTSHIKLKSLST